MLRCLSLLAACLCSLTALAAAQGVPGVPPALLPAERVPGGVADGARYVARHGGLTARLRDDAIALTLSAGSTAGATNAAGAADAADAAGAADAPRAVELVLRLPGTGVHVAPRGSAGRAHLYLGDDPAAWAQDVALPEALVYRGLPHGVEVEVHGRHGRLGYDVHVPAGVPLRDVVLHLDGADALSVDDAGRLVAVTPVGRLVQSVPAAWTVGPDGARTPVQARLLALGGGAFGFAAPARPLDRALVIDPDLTFSSYLGGALWDRIAAVADAGDGQVVVAGFTTSPDFPVTPGAQQGALQGFAAAFVSRIDLDAGTLVWSTFLGGNDAPFLVNEQATCLALDAAGAAHVAGYTVAGDFPTTPGAFRTSSAGGFEGFVAKLGADGLLQWSSYLGGGKDDRVNGLAVGAAGVVVTGWTTSNAAPLFPTTVGAYDTSFNSIFFTPDGFVTCFAANGASLNWSTLLGGVLRDEPRAVHLSPSGQVTVAGLTGSTDFPTTVGAYDTTYNGTTTNETDAFVTRLAAGGGSLVWSTFLGGDVMVDGRALSVDASGRATVAGIVAGADFPTTPGALQPVYGGGATDAFVARLAAGGAALETSTFLGGGGEDAAHAVRADAFGLATVAGLTDSDDLPVTPGALSGARAGGTDGLLARLSPDGGALRYGSYVGGSGDDALYGLALDAFGAGILGGETLSADLATGPVSVDTSFGGGGGDGLLVRLDLPPWADRGKGKPGTGDVTPVLVGGGSLEVGSPGALTLTDARPSSAAYLFAGLFEGNAPFKGGTLVPFPPQFTLVLVTSPAGTLPLGWGGWPAGVPPGFSLYFQFWVQDPGGYIGSSASNAVRGTVP